MKDYLRVIDIRKEAEGLSEAFKPKHLISVHGIAVRLARISGVYKWHQHTHEDELFYVLEGTLFIDTPDASIKLEQGQALLVPRGLRHRSRVDAGEAVVLLVEPQSTITTGENPGDS